MKTGIEDQIDIELPCKCIEYEGAAYGQRDDGDCKRQSESDYFIMRHCMISSVLLIDSLPCLERNMATVSLSISIYGIYPMQSAYVQLYGQLWYRSTLWERVS